MLRPLAFIALLVFAATTVAQDELPVVLSEFEEGTALRAAELKGDLIFQHDRAAAVADDALQKVREFRRNSNLQGWITEGQGDEVRVTFIGSDKSDGLAAHYRVRVDGNGRIIGKPSILKVPEALTDFEAAAARARGLAVGASFQPCSEQYNTVTLPVGSGLEQWVVYLLPGTAKRNVVPLGGSYRIEVDNAAESIKVRPYTKTCIQLQNDPSVVGLMVTHMLDPIPTEVHVFWSLWAQKPLYVVTSPHGSVWSVDGGRIGLVRRGEEG